MLELNDMCVPKKTTNQVNVSCEKVTMKEVRHNLFWGNYFSI